MTPPNMETWQAQGEFIDIDGRRIFVIDTKEIHKPTLCILHGYPTCVYDYWKALALLSEKYRVVMHDHLGFGLSDKPIDYEYQLIDQADLAFKLWKKLGIDSCHLLAHDYGTSIATEMIYRNNQNQTDITFTQITLCNGSMHIELSQLRPIQKLLKNKFFGPLVARLTNKAILKRNFKKIYSDATKLDDAEIDAIWAMILHNNGRRVLSKITRL